MIPDVSLPYDIPKPGIGTPLLFPAGVSLREQGISTARWLVVAVPRHMGETGPAFLSINEQVCYCHFLKHKMEIPGTYLSLRF